MLFFENNYFQRKVVLCSGFYRGSKKKKGISMKDSPIEGVVVERLNLVHSDQRRDLFTVFNGNFTARQVKLADIKGEDIALGCHWHPYEEMFLVLAGSAKFH